MSPVRHFLTSNPIVGLRTSLRRAPASTWLLVPPYVLVAVVLGFGAGLFTWEWPSGWELLLPIALVLHPAITEEFIFRGILLPRSLIDASAGRQFGAVMASTALFVIMHPFNAWFVGLSDTSLFTSPAFLVIVTALGVTNGYAYLRSGSLWAPIAIHWATVAVWNLFLGRDLTI